MFFHGFSWGFGLTKNSGRFLIKVLLCFSNGFSFLMRKCDWYWIVYCSWPCLEEILMNDVYLDECCVVSQQEIVSLYQRFCQLDRSGGGFISGDEFMNVPEFAVNPLSQVAQTPA